MFITILILVALAYIIYRQEKNNPTGLSSLSWHSGRRIIIDSCVLIDGRIIDLIKTNFINKAQLVIPRFVVNELQLLADGNDPHKRKRARYGLDVAKELQSMNVDVEISQRLSDSDLPTDDRLVLLAKTLRADLYTTDFNLNKVASLEGIRVLNINQLAQALRPIKLPGEHESVRLIQKGSNAGQGVGYLEDGTMIVVDGGSRYIGKTVTVEIDHMLQTVAGKMAFGRMVRSDAKTKSADRRNK